MITVQRKVIDEIKADDKTSQVKFSNETTFHTSGCVHRHNI